MKQLFTEEQAERIWSLCGSFGKIEGEVTRDGNTLSAQKNGVCITTSFAGSCGVTEWNSELFNSRDTAVQVYAASCRIAFPGAEYEVYTQFNGWQQESRGAWQPLQTAVSASSKSVRGAFGAAPFMCLWNRQTNRGMVFHLISDGLWEIKAEVAPTFGENSETVVTLGLASEQLCLELAPGERMALPQILSYPFTDRQDMNCDQLHFYMNKRAPRTHLPAVYNTWLYRFDQFSYEEIFSQIAPAAELGLEYFVVDAGWFGKPGERWGNCRGDWTEAQEDGFYGKMDRIADEVRAHGMKFGLWIEVEVAVEGTDILRDHPEWFLSNGTRDHILNFALPEAREYLLSTLSGLIERYGIEWIKFDFNSNLFYDETNGAFTRYGLGYREWIRCLREKFPSVYLENCASGGMRMTLRDGLLCDSFWPTDNQSPYDSQRIFKDTLLRMPPQWIEKWATVTSLSDFVPCYTEPTADKILATGDAVWDHLTEVTPSFLKGFLSGGAVCFSCDLTALSETAFADLKQWLADWKQDREFWKTAGCRILADTDSFLVLQYADEAAQTVRVQVFCSRIRQDRLTVFPKVDPSARYRYGAEEYDGKTLAEEGICVQVKSYEAYLLTLTKIG